jgi:hypothetical protein
LAFIDAVPRLRNSVLLLGDNRNAMFVDDIEFRNNSEVAGFDGQTSKFSADVWLNLLDQCEDFWSNESLDFFPGMIEGFLINTDGKSSLTAATERIATDDGQLTGEMIKGGAQIMNYIPDKQRPAYVVRRDLFKRYLYAPPIRIVFEGRKMVALFRGSPNIESHCQIREVVFSSINFGPDSPEITSRHRVSV